MEDPEKTGKVNRSIISYILFRQFPIRCTQNGKINDFFFLLRACDPDYLQEAFRNKKKL